MNCELCNKKQKDTVWINKSKNKNPNPIKNQLGQDGKYTFFPPTWNPKQDNLSIKNFHVICHKCVIDFRIKND